MKTLSKLFLIVIVTAAFSISSCKKTVEPSVTTIEVTSITAQMAMTGGNVTEDGGADITQRGVCYSRTNANPTIDDDKTTNGTGTGVYSSQLSGLFNGATYYVRAYAVNEVGTSYGAVITFNTLP